MHTFVLFLVNVVLKRNIDICETYDRSEDFYMGFGIGIVCS